MQKTTLHETHNLFQEKKKSKEQTSSGWKLRTTLSKPERRECSTLLPQTFYT